jgi:hypothetical protein
MCSHPDPLADWRAVSVVGRVRDVYLHLIFKTYCETERLSDSGTLYSGGLGFVLVQVNRAFPQQVSAGKSLKRPPDRFSPHSFQL